MNTRQKREETQRRREVLKGSAEQVIRVSVPVPGMIREAVFFLHGDYLRREGVNREELIAQARRAALDYLRPYAPPCRPALRWPLPLLILAGTALGFGLGAVIGI